MVACRPNLDEIRNIKERGPSPIMNIALYHSMLSDILGGESSAQEKRREEKRSWLLGDEDKGMVCLCCI